jgi:hypothetical protein
MSLRVITRVIAAAAALQVTCYVVGNMQHHCSSLITSSRVLQACHYHHVTNQAIVHSLLQACKVSYGFVCVE